MPLLSLTALVKILSLVRWDTGRRPAVDSDTIIGSGTQDSSNSRPTMAKASASAHLDGLCLMVVLQIESEPHPTFSLTFCLLAQHSFELNILLCYAWTGRLQLIQLCPHASKIECSTQLSFYSPSHITINKHYVTLRNNTEQHAICAPSHKQQGVLGTVLRLHVWQQDSLPCYQSELRSEVACYISKHMYLQMCIAPLLYHTPTANAEYMCSMQLQKMA